MKTRAQKSSHAAGAVGPNAFLPRYLIELAKKGIIIEEPILDFGCGHKALHTIALRGQGYDVVPFDLSIAKDHPLWDERCLEIKFKTVFASNVFNVLESKEELDKTLDQVINMMTISGKFYLNFPRCGPHYCQSITKVSLDFILRERFEKVEMREIGKYKNNAVWCCSHPKDDI